MSLESVAVVLHHSRAKGTAKLVLLGIANHEGDGGAWPSVATLATYANVTPRNVQKSIDQLQSLGEVRVLVQQGGTHATADHMRPNSYRVLVTCPPWCDRTAQHRDTRRYSAQPSLWKTGVSNATPPVGNDTPPPVGNDTPPPVGNDTRTVPKNQADESTHSPASTYDRAREPLCVTCLRHQSDCERIGPARSGHRFEPKKETRTA
ncbi:hypothetical protein GCM10027425_09150 [Alteromonas gracilis]